MPHIRVRGMPFEIVESISAELIESVAKITEAPNSHFTLEYQAVTYIVAGGASPSYPFFDIIWFDRGQEVKTKVASCIDHLIRPLIPEEQDIAIVFHSINGENYYENTEHF
ncbi:DUF1904 family protein [Marinomonas sp. 2405UD68-3]|uniref:DUF1904 family protein n=1 Tax=Marinomonas sp. 2405UD68-3 TaxID=3391835 RepID=UPI0039C99FFC